MRQRSLDEMITYFTQEIDKMDIDRKHKISLLGMVVAIGCTAQQTIDERKKGKWIMDRLVTSTGGTYGVRRCSECESYYQDIGYGWNYCPDCGAEMEGEE